jgi:NAD+ synthase
MTTPQGFSAESLRIDPKRETDRIVALLRRQAREFKRRGAVVALSGGIDSSVVGALCVRALGKGSVFGLSMPERDSSDATPDLSRRIIERLEIDSAVIDITPILEALGCYRARDEAIRRVIPEYQSDWKSKIVLPSVTDSSRYRLFSVVVQSPDGAARKERLARQEYLGIVAATNFKQRVRKTLEYYHADRLNYFVAGTPNRLEYDQGFFVKLGDGAADIKPIAHLYKTQVYQLAEHLDVPEVIRNRPPLTDTYSMEQSQEEFFFSLPYDKMDLCLYAKNMGLEPADVAAAVGLTARQVEGVYLDIDTKRENACYLHAAPVVVRGNQASKVAGNTD